MPDMLFWEDGRCTGTTPFTWRFFAWQADAYLGQRRKVQLLCFRDKRRQAHAKTRQHAFMACKFSVEKGGYPGKAARLTSRIYPVLNNIVYLSYPLANFLFWCYSFIKYFLWSALFQERFTEKTCRNSQPSGKHSFRHVFCFILTQERKPMSYTRRGFLKLAGVSALCLSLSQFGFNLGEAQAYAGSLKIEGAKEVITICPFCAVCCQVIAYVRDGKLVSTEGDPDFPVNEGALCAKGAALFSMYTNPHRLTKPLYRAPYSEKWEEKDWGWMLEKIARRVKDTRDKDLILKNSKGQTVNRLESIFMMGTSHASNEECAVIHQSMRGLGVVQMDHQARV